jgi:hypothetical protein
LQTGKLRALATTAAARVPVLPNVPTVIESGYRDVEAEFYGGVMAPAKTPQAITSQLIRWFSDAIKTNEIKAKFASRGFIPAAGAVPILVRLFARITTITVAPPARLACKCTERFLRCYVERLQKP